jgi:hypothetical protein
MFGLFNESDISLEGHSADMCDKIKPFYMKGILSLPEFNEKKTRFLFLQLAFKRMKLE